MKKVKVISGILKGEIGEIIDHRFIDVHNVTIFFVKFAKGIVPFYASEIQGLGQ